MAFIDAWPDQWHNDVLGPFTINTLQHLRLDTVRKQGYVNLRCTHVPGCPIGLNPLSPSQEDIASGDIRAKFADVYMELFEVPRSAVPEHIGNVCCAQFAVTKERVLQRPKEDYERMLNWAIHGKETDSFGVGWVFEKIWHIIFQMDSIL